MHLLSVIGVMILNRSIVNLVGGRCMLSICAFCYMCNLFGYGIWCNDVFSICASIVTIASIP